MTKTNWALHIVSFAIIALLALDRVGAFKDKDDKKSVLSEEGAKEVAYAYINSDTLSAKYEYIADRAQALANREAQLQKQLETKVQALEARFAQLQQKADIMTRAELEAAQNEIQSKEAEVNNLRIQLSQQLDQERLEMQLDLYNKVEDVLKGMANENDLHTIFSYTQGGQVLYIDPKLDITEKVLNVLNEQYQEGKK